MKFCSQLKNSNICLHCWQVGVAFLLFLLLVVLAIGVIHHWASHNFYLTRIEVFLVCLAAFVLALAAFLVGLLAGVNNSLPFWGPAYEVLFEFHVSTCRIAEQ